MTHNQYKILIVDDSKSNLRILGATFEDAGFIVYSASNVKTAQELLILHKTQLDLVLSDIQMPGLTGFDLVKWMKSELSEIKDIPILLITSQLPDSEHRILGLSLGAVDYLLRSLDPQELVIRVTHAIDNFANIKNLRHSLESTECLASTGRLFAASNHEIKNVTQIIYIVSGILERELNPNKMDVPETCQQALKMLQQSSQLLVDITRMIGGIVHNGDSPMGRVDLRNVVDQVALMTKPLLKNEVDVEFAIGSSQWVFGSSTFLQQILINLILNARDAILENKADSQGKIAIHIEPVENDSIALVVIDNGSGFPSRDTRTDFQPFASTKQMRGGSGLGLWLSSHLANKMGGSLTLSSEGPGRGATATVVLKKGGE